MLELKLEQGNALKKIIEAIKEIIKEVNLNITKKGIFIQALDISRVAIVTINLEQQGFQSYICKKETNLGLHLDYLNKILKCMEKNDTITLYAEDQPSNIRLTFESKDSQNFTKPSYNQKLINYKFLKLNIVLLLLYQVHHFQKFVKTQVRWLKIVSILQKVYIETTKDTVIFSINGDDVYGSIILNEQLNNENLEEQVKLNVKKKVKLLYSLKYLNQFNKAQSLSSQVRLHLSQDIPLCVEFTINALGNMKYYLAAIANEP